MESVFDLLIFRQLVGMSDEIYAATSRYSFLMFILVMRSGAVSELVGVFPDTILIFLASLFGWHLRTA